MGVEKTGNYAGSGRLNKNSVNLYRPPALRKIDATLNDDRNDKFAQKRNETKTTNSELIINNQEIIENKVQTNINVTVNRPVKKERRPDRAVYIPRARRSQIIASSQVNDTTNNTITESTTSNISSSSSFCLATSNHTDNNKSNSNIKNSNNTNSSGISSSSSSIGGGGGAAAAVTVGTGGPPTKRNSNRSSSSSSSTLQSTSRSYLSNNTTTNNLTTNTAPNTTTTQAITNIITNLTDIGDSNNYYTNSIIKDNPKRLASSSSSSFNQNIQNFMIYSDIDNSYCDNYKNSPPPPQQLPKHNIITNESNNHNHNLPNSYTTSTTNDISDNCISTQVLNISSISATTATTTKTELNNDLLSINSSLVEVNNLNNSNTFDIDCDKIYKNNNYSQDYNNYLDNNSFNNYIDTVDCVQSNNFLNNMFTNNIVENDQKQNQIQLQKNNVLKIEDAAVIIDRKTINDKDDNKDIEELQRASKEINRSNRCIIKQTFNSDILEIPEPDDIIMKKQKSGNYIQNNKEELYDNRKTKDIDPENDDWESMFDDNGECIDPKIISELTASVGKVKIEIPKNDYKAYHVKHSILNDEEFPHVLEISNFPVEFKTQDLMMIFSTYKESGFDIKWVDDTHALAVFSSSRIAAEVLSKGHPFVILKPLAEATIESRTKAKKCSSSLQPYRPRPETCAALARRLVTGALGVRLKTAAQERENEKRVLKEAKERKLLAAKQRDEIWES